MVALQHGWRVPTYHGVYRVVKQLDPALVTLAHAGTKAYRTTFDLLYRREAAHANDIWQADHTLLDLWVLRENGPPARPWLTVIMDDYSRAIAGFGVNFQAPSALQTALVLRQAVWRKTIPQWQICGIPGTFYMEYVPRHIFEVMCPFVLCGCVVASAVVSRQSPRWWPHNAERDGHGDEQRYITLPNGCCGASRRHCGRRCVKLKRCLGYADMYVVTTSLQRPCMKEGKSITAL
jgi:hypothetical protein